MARIKPADGHWAEDYEAYSDIWDEIDLELNPCPYCASDCAGCARAGEPTEPVPADELRRRFQARLEERLLASSR